MPALVSVVELVERFDSNLDAYRSGGYNEAQLRQEFLNPPEWTREEVLEFPGSVDGPWARYVRDPDPNGIGTVRYPRTVPRDEECARELKKRTLTNLYNQSSRVRETHHSLAKSPIANGAFHAPYVTGRGACLLRRVGCGR